MYWKQSVASRVNETCLKRISELYACHISYIRSSLLRIWQGQLYDRRTDSWLSIRKIDRMDFSLYINKIASRKKAAGVSYMTAGFLSVDHCVVKKFHRSSLHNKNSHIMISIKVMLDDFQGNRVPVISRKHFIRQDQRIYHRSRSHKKETIVRGNTKYDSMQETSPYYTYNYHHGKSSQMQEKRSKDRNEQFDRSRETDSNKVLFKRIDYHHGSVSMQDEPISNKKSDKSTNNENNCEFYRRNYYQTSKPISERNDKRENVNRQNSELSENLFLQNSDTRTRCFVERSEPRSNGGSILRPPILPIPSISNDNSSSQIREIVSVNNPVLNDEPVGSAGPATDKASEKRDDKRYSTVQSKSRRSGKRVQTRKEMARVRKRIARLSLQPKSTPENTKPTDSPPAPIHRPTTSTSSTQTPSQLEPAPPQPLVIDADYEQTIIDIYRCEKCHSLCLPELYECGAGHSVCEECWLCLSRCPGVHETEHNAGSFRRALGLEKLAKFLKFPCPWQEEGCQERLGSDAWKDHAARCSHLVGNEPEEMKVQPTVMDSGLDSDDDVVVILDEDEEYEFESGAE